MAKKTMKRRSTEAQSLSNYTPKIIPNKRFDYTRGWSGNYDDWYFENDRMSLDPPEEDTHGETRKP